MNHARAKAQTSLSLWLNRFQQNGQNCVPFSNIHIPKCLENVSQKLTGRGLISNISPNFKIV